MTHTYYPVALDLSGRRCVVVGGGAVATERVHGLVGVGAQVVVISPAVAPSVADLASAGRVSLYQRHYEPADVIGAFLVIAAMDDRRVNAVVAAAARQAGALVNAVDDPPNCDFFAVSLVRRGDLQIAISTNGQSPAFARWMREQLDASLPAQYADLLTLLAGIRATLKARGSIPPYEQWRDAITPEVLSLLAGGDRESAQVQLVTSLGAATAKEAAVAAGVDAWKERSL